MGLAVEAFKADEKEFEEIFGELRTAVLSPGATDADRIRLSVAVLAHAMGNALEVTPKSNDTATG